MSTAQSPIDNKTKTRQELNLQLQAPVAQRTIVMTDRHVNSISLSPLKLSTQNVPAVNTRIASSYAAGYPWDRGDDQPIKLAQHLYPKRKVPPLTETFYRELWNTCCHRRGNHRIACSTLHAWTTSQTLPGCDLIKQEYSKSLIYFQITSGLTCSTLLLGHGMA
jgi:hypothetical protein